ncbi:DNA uptake protein [Belliella baltica DSM 15883]|uniref:DNA uptake protein n=1 Tax=Belliella baltica (strain DSM 15883 / CIP 108006 / LMG 21964 / BA134) TaxID=866536 RepID=I3ZAA3_BELBD|nr:helix-hairpin-helix domain-containing protein [Belliella baltica]AFL86171.1 DNA uptake protein [Belliella baltica DSM 15883]
MIRKMKFFLKNYLGFSNRESRGFILLVPALLLLYAVPVIYNNILAKRNQIDYEIYLEKMDSLESAGWHKVETQYFMSQDTSKRRQPQLNKISFDEADSIVLQIVPGVGPATAGRIIKFRDAIGGMHTSEQLLDVYGMSPEVMERVFEYFEFTPGIKTKININTADVPTLAAHPYINYGSAKVIVAYRDQHGAYTTADDLLKVRIFSQEWIDRIRPYLTY